MRIYGRIILYIVSLTLIGASGYAQSPDLIKGKVRILENNNRVPVEGALVKWVGTDIGTETGPDGSFSLSREGVTDQRLFVSYTGYFVDTVLAENKKFVFPTLKPYSTTEITIIGKENTTSISDGVGLTQNINQGELEKAACCDLSGCFGTNTSVEVKVTDAVTKTKDMQLLGVNGSYTQVLIDNLPIMNGLTKKYGISSIPGTLINSIAISKGSNSVLQGYESISGIINILLKDYETSDRFFVNGFINEVLEKQFNVNYGKSFGEWNTLISGHTVQKSERIDDNGDGFLDHPLVTRYLVYNKWNYSKSETEGVDIAWKYLNEKRIGGQTDFNDDTDLGGNQVYGQTADLEQYEFYSRGSIQTGEESSLKVSLSAEKYNEDSYYGYTDYNGKQVSVYSGLYFETPVFEKSLLKFGASYRYEDINEDIAFLESTSKTYNGVYGQKESVPGIFIENFSNLFDNKLELLTGIRLDHHNEYDFFVTPRALVKYVLDPNTTLRASVGTGFRTVKIFSEYSSILASSRNIIITEDLQPEKALNFGVNLVRYFDLNDISGNFVVDFYRTNFINQVIPDYDSDPSEVTFENLNGDSYSNILQAEVNTNILKNFDVKISYKYSDVRYTQNGIEQEYPFVAKHTALGSISYAPDSDSWSADLIAEWFGKKRLPSTESNPVQYQRPEESTPYTLLNLQFTKNWELFEFYTGIENVLDYKQDNPIIDSSDPFGPYFDTSFIWGPTMGRELYAGFRFRIN